MIHIFTSGLNSAARLNALFFASRLSYRRTQVTYLDVLENQISDEQILVHLFEGSRIRGMVGVVAATAQTAALIGAECLSEGLPVTVHIADIHDYDAKILTQNADNILDGERECLAINSLIYDTVSDFIPKSRIVVKDYEGNEIDSYTLLNTNKLCCIMDKDSIRIGDATALGEMSSGWDYSRIVCKEVSFGNDKETMYYLKSLVSKNDYSNPLVD